MTDLLSMSRITADAECLRSVKPPYTFGKSEYLGNAVTCTVSSLDGIKDWIGDNTIFAMWKDMVKHQLIITFNGISFDYPLWGGSMFGPEHIEAKRFFEKSLKGKTIDLLKDFQEALGVRVGLNAVAIPTLGDAKELEGGFAPDHWRAGRCMEVIEYCRGDIRRTENLFLKAAAGEELKVQTKDGQIRTFKCTPKIR
jgi:hypothetical protein